MLTSNTKLIPVSLMLLLSGCVFNSGQVKQEQESPTAVAPTAISALQVACANNAQSIEELKLENAKIKGELEKLSHLLEQRDEAKVEDVSVTTQTPATTPTTAVAASAVVAATAETKKAETTDVDELYKLARKNHEQKNYTEAEKYYTAMLGSKSTWFDEKARYFLGKMYSDAGDNKKAIITFQDFVDKYPKSKNVANAVYAQAECFIALNQKQEAVVFLKDIVQRFPKTTEAKLAKQRLKSL